MSGTFDQRDGESFGQKGDVEGHYAALGVSCSASVDELLTAYRDAVSRWHPDRHTERDGSAQLARLDDAAEILLDPALRADYDRVVVASQRSATVQWPPTIPTPPVLRSASPMRMDIGNWHSAEPRWPWWIPVIVLGSWVALVALEVSGAIRLGDPEPVVNIPDIQVGWPLLMGVTAVALAMVVSTRLFTRGGPVLKSLTVLVALPGVLVSSAILGWMLFLVAFAVVLFGLLFVIFVRVVWFVIRLSVAGVE